MAVILKPCLVPWMVSPSMSGVTLQHSETDSNPECTVVFGGGRLGKDGLVDCRRIEITFDLAWYARSAPHHDNADIESIGYELVSEFDAPRVHGFSEWWKGVSDHWKATGYSPHPNFYVAVESDWLESVGPRYGEYLKHYVIYGRDGHVEVLAKQYRWREWIWLTGVRDALTDEVAFVASGEGVE